MTAVSPVVDAENYFKVAKMVDGEAQLDIFKGYALDIPDAARVDRKSLEILRVWVNSNGQHVSLRTRVWDDPSAWGLMLADLAGHIANAYEQEGYDREEVLGRIIAGLEAELDSPTDLPAGSRLSE